MTRLNGKTAEKARIALSLFLEPSSKPSVRPTIRDRHDARGNMLCEVLPSKGSESVRSAFEETLDIAIPNTIVQRLPKRHTVRAGTQCSMLNGLREAQAAPQPPYP